MKMAYAKTVKQALERVAIKRTLRRVGNVAFRNDEPTYKLKEKLNQFPSVLESSRTITKKRRRK